MFECWLRCQTESTMRSVLRGLGNLSRTPLLRTNARARPCLSRGFFPSTPFRCNDPQFVAVVQRGTLDP